MRLLACDPLHKYFFLGVSEVDIEEQIIPLQESLLAEYAHDAHPHLLVTSKELRDKEIADQKAFKRNPYCRKAQLFSRNIHEVPEEDAYIVVKPDLSELYFVPFNHCVDPVWDKNNQWCRVDKRNVKNIAELVDFPFTRDGGKPYKAEWTYTNGEAEGVYDDLVAYINTHKKDKKELFRRIMNQYQAYHLYIDELSALLYRAKIVMPAKWWDQDQMHLKTQVDYFDEKEESFEGTRTKEEEYIYLDTLLEEGMDADHVTVECFFDYLDGIIPWEWILEEFADHPSIDKLNRMNENQRKRFIFLDLYNPKGSSI